MTNRQRYRRTPRTSARMVVVGTGPAGLSAAEEARRLGFDGLITMIGDEPVGPYDRPACSKGLLTGHQIPRDVRVPVRPGLDLDWQLGRRAVHLDPYNREVTVDSGHRYGYEGLVIATGARPSLPAGWPAGEPGLHVLHGLHDAWALRQDLRWARRVAIVGGGLTGCEVACAVRALARQAVLINPGPYLMGRALGEPIGRLVTAEHEAAGIELRLGRRVAAVDRDRRGWRLYLDDGERDYADVVVVTAGERPDVGWLEGVGLDLSDGVLCDASLRVLGLPGAVAAGVLARWPNPWSGGRPARVGQWIAAMEHGRAAAHTLLAGDRPVAPATLLPRFWSQQNDLRIQVCGHLPADADIQLTGRSHRHPSARSGVLASYHRDGQLIGLVAVNAAPAFTALARAMLVTPPAPEPTLRALPPGPSARRPLTLAG